MSSANVQMEDGYNPGDREMSTVIMLTEDELVCLAYWMETQMVALANNPEVVKYLVGAMEKDEIDERDMAVAYVVNTLAKLTERLIDAAEAVMGEGEDDGELV